MDTTTASAHDENRQRSLKAARVVAYYMETNGLPDSDELDAITDILANVLHYADRQGFSAHDAFLNALSHYEVETVAEADEAAAKAEAEAWR